MVILNEKEGFEWVKIYYKEPKLKMAAIEWFMTALEPIVDQQAHSLRAKISLQERRSEAILCLLVGFEQSVKQGSCKDFQESFQTAIREALKKYSLKHKTVSLNEASEKIQDPGPDPHKVTELNQEFTMAKAFLEKRYKASLVTQFMEKFAEGKTYNEIALKHGKTVATVQQKLMPMLDKVQKYMRRMRGW